MSTRAAGRGFTIIELMVVVGIIGILSAFALPAVKDMVTVNRMKTVSLDLYTSLTLARSEAIKRNAANVTMAPNGSWGAGWTVCVDDNLDGACGGGETVIITGDATDSAITVSGPGGGITYNRDGRLSTAVAFRITAGTNSTKTPMRCVDVTTSGRPATRLDSNGADGDGCQS